MTTLAPTSTRTYVVSGAASGIGAATVGHLAEQGHRLITVDRHDADVVADLSTPAGRAEAVAAVRALTDVVHGLVPAAGIAGLTGGDPGLVASVNFFGAIGLVRGLRAELAAAGDASVVLLASNSITAQPNWPVEVAEALLGEDETAARAAAAGHDAVMIYPASKAALAWWARGVGTTPEWIGAGIRVNAVAPGKVATPMASSVGADPVLGELIDAFVSPLGRDGRPEEIAAAIAFLLSPSSSLFVGSVLLADGGMDAMLHPRSPEPWQF